MCGRFSLGLVYGFSTRFGIPEDIAIKPRYNISPFQEIPVIVNEGQNAMKWMRWGMVPSWAKGEDFGLKLINIRSETALDKSMFKRLLATKRCIIPATGFYEWQRSSTKKRPYYVHVPDSTLFSMAGIYDVWRGEGKELHTCSILTTASNDLLRPVHDRMPVILRRSMEEEWLRSGPLSEDMSVSMLTPYPSLEMEMYPVSDLVNDPRADDSAMTSPVRAQQATLF